MQISELARKTEVQAIVAFGVVAAVGYYFMLKNRKEKLQWANAGGMSKTAEPKEVTICKQQCLGSENWNRCMYDCINKYTIAQ